MRFCADLDPSILLGGGSSSNVGAIVGGVIGLCAVIALIVVVAVYTQRKFQWTDTGM